MKKNLSILLCGIAMLLNACNSNDENFTHYTLVYLEAYPGGKYNPDVIISMESTFEQLGFEFTSTINDLGGEWDVTDATQFKSTYDLYLGETSARLNIVTEESGADSIYYSRTEKVYTLKEGQYGRYTITKDGIIRNFDNKVELELENFTYSETYTTITSQKSFDTTTNYNGTFSVSGSDDYRILENSDYAFTVSNNDGAYLLTMTRPEQKEIGELDIVAD